MTSEIEQIIPPEIVGDELHALIERLSRTEALKHVLEIGSSAGGGSTSAFVAGLAANPGHPSLYCMELSKPRYEALRQTYADKPFVRCFNASSVPLSAFPDESDVAEFYQHQPTSLNKYPLDQVLGWLRQDIAYVQQSGAPQEGIELIKRDAGIDHFDMVLIDGSEFTGDAELDRVIGARIILLDDTNAFKCHAARRRLLADARYELIADNQTLRNGYSAFRRRDLVAQDDPPVHFFTIVLNGEPFIRAHLAMMQSLPFRWRWHIVEGVASLVHDTAWSVQGGGRIDASLHEAGRSNDGTSAYLDEIAAAYPDQISLYRKPSGVFWDGKKEMVAAPLAQIKEPCLLWQIDSDELWTAAQIIAVREAFREQPERTAAYFWCDYFVGPRALVSTRYNYAQNPAQEWLRVWRYQPGDHWGAHEPPTLLRRAGFGRTRDIARIAPFLHDETEAMGAVFQHFAYATPEQLRFKEIYYGYAGAVERWRVLQQQDFQQGPQRLGDYFPWVTDETLIDGADTLGVEPMAAPDEQGVWRFKQTPAARHVAPPGDGPRIVVDGVFFQHNSMSGIARVWRTLLTAWRAQGFAKHIIVLDRAGAAPRLSGIRYRSIPAWDERRTGADSLMLQKVCDEEGADVFVSSYHTSPVSTPSVFLAHDMIPERLGVAGEDPALREKRCAILHASRFIAISESTKRDLLRFYPDVPEGDIEVALNAADESFKPASNMEVEAFRAAHDLQKPYILLVGERLGLNGYKNGAEFFRFIGEWPKRSSFTILCVGGMDRLEEQLQRLAPDVDVRVVRLDDAALAVAYSGAAALVYPSLMEGFGLPVLEAMTCGCPVVTVRASSLPEVGGEAALYFEPEDRASLKAALETAIDPLARARLAQAGLAQAKRFSWARAAEQHAHVLRAVADGVRAGALTKPSPLWRVLREELAVAQAGAAKGAGAARGATGLTSPIAQSPLRAPLFAARAALLKALPSWAVPAARRGWRVIMGVRT